MAGGTQIIISPEGITVKTVGYAKFFAADHIFEGGAVSEFANFIFPTLGGTEGYTSRFQLNDQDDHPFINQKYIAFLENGNTIEGCTDENGYTEYFDTPQSENINFHLLLNDKLEID